MSVAGGVPAGVDVLLTLMSVRDLGWKYNPFCQYCLVFFLVAPTRELAWMRFARQVLEAAL